MKVGDNYHLRYELYVGNMRIATNSIIELYRWAFEYAGGEFPWAIGCGITLIDFKNHRVMNWHGQTRRWEV